MITERDIDQAIAECRADRDPRAWTCIRLAAFLIIKKELFGDPEQLPAGYPMPQLPAASYAPPPDPPEAQTIDYTSKTEFGTAIAGKRAADIWPIIDELMTITRTLHPEIYDRVMELVK